MPTLGKDEYLIKGNMNIIEDLKHDAFMGACANWEPEVQIAYLKFLFQKY